MRLMIIFFVSFISSCTLAPPSIPDGGVKITHPELPIVDSALIGEPMNIHTVNDIFRLTPEQQKDFQYKFDSRNYRSLPPSRRIFKYLQNHLSNFNFHSDTLTASDVLSQDLGNCLSLAILTKSLTNMTKVDIKYELVETPPVFQKEGEILLSSQHIRTVLRDKELRSAGVLNLLQNKVIIDYFPSRGTRTLRKVTESEFYSMFYSNKAAEALIKKNPKLAYWYLKKSLELKPDNALSINTMAVVHQALGFIEHAEKLYLYGLKYGNEKMELLSNYYNLLAAQERFSEAKKIEIQLDKYDISNPFKWIELADATYNAKNYSTAIRYYKKAADMADYLHEPYAGIARAQYLLGNTKQARRAIKKALENSHKQETTSLYQTKYELFLEELKNE